MGRRRAGGASRGESGLSRRKASGDRKAEILSTTLELAFDVGPDHVTTSMIAARLGLTQPAIYKHFPKKEDIWLAISSRLCATISENTVNCAQMAGSPVDGIRSLILNHLCLIAETPALPEIMATRDPTGALTKARGNIQAAMTEFRGALNRRVEQARLEGYFPAGLSTQDGVTLLLGIIQSLVLRLIVTRDPAILVQEGDRLLNLQLSFFMGA